jgi:hypothetical protein
MTKKEQQNFISDTIDSLNGGGITLGYFLNTIHTSRSHWHFIKKGERPLTEEKKEAIIKFLKERLLFETD